LISILKSRLSKRSRSYLRISWIALFCILLLFLLSGSCVSTIRPPAKINDPCEVYLLKEASHVGIVLPDFEGGYVEYGYGDWDWYAMMCNSWYHTFDTILWPTQGCLGRRTISSRDSKPHHESAELQLITVEKIGACRLLKLLSDGFNKNISTLHHNRAYGIEFVHHDAGFWLFNNCNDLLVDWMIYMGCEASWRPVCLGVDVQTR